MLRRLLTTLRAQPIESIVLLGIPGFAAFVVLLAQPGGGAYALTGALRFATLQFFFGGAFLAIFFALLYIYLAYRVAIGIIHLMRAVSREQRMQQIRYATRIVGSGLYILLILGGASMLSHLIIGPLATTSAEKVSAASDLLMQWDKRVFGVYVPFWITQFGAGVFDTVFVWAYKVLSVLTSFLLLALITTRTHLFRLFIIAFFLASYLAAPLWYAFPAVSPEEMYRQNMLERTFSPDVATDIPNIGQLPPALATYLQGIEGRWSNASAGTFAVTTFPSMHAAWGLIVAYVAILLWRPLGLVVIPWTIANLIATIYTLQHYAVDTLAGACMAVIAVALAHLLLRMDERGEPVSRHQFFAFADMVQKDIRAAMQGIATLIRS